MKVIITRFIPGGLVRGNRYQATDGDGNTVYCSDNAVLPYEEKHFQAALKLCFKMGWHGQLVSGTLMKSGRDYAHAWVWLPEGQGDADVFTISADPLVQAMLKAKFHLE